VLEAEAAARGLVERPPIGEGGFQQGERAVDICLDERCGTGDGAIDVAFRCEMQDRVGPELREDGVDRRAIADVDLVVSVPIAGSRLKAARMAPFPKLHTGYWKHE
jgi:hypothetical protein